MFPTRYFPNSYFAPRYWPKIGAESEAVPLIVICTIGQYVNSLTSSGQYVSSLTSTGQYVNTLTSTGEVGVC